MKKLERPPPGGLFSFVPGSVCALPTLRRVPCCSAATDLGRIRLSSWRIHVLEIDTYEGLQTMKVFAKTIVAAAVLACASSAALAQSNVTLYGVLDVGIQQTKLSPGTTTTGLASGLQSGSRFGLKGSEDLGGGMSASFQLENGFSVANGSLGQGGLIFGRQAWAGLNGDFGSIKLGRQYTPLFIALDTIDPFDFGITGDGAGTGAVFRSAGVRMNNTVNYSTKDMAGFSATVAYGFGNVAGNSSTNRQIGLGLNYAAGPLTLAFAYHDANLVTGANVPAGKSKTTFIGGVYDLKAVKVHGAYALNKDNNAGGVTTEDSRDTMLGVTVPMGNLDLLASYVRHSDKRIGNADAGYWQLGATYNLSKRTNFYTSYSKVNNDVAGAVASGIPGADISWLNVGIRHRF